MKYGQPFGRAQAMMATIAAIVTQFAGNLAAQQAAIGKLGSYESRGKGKGGRNRHAPGAGKANHRAAMKRRNQLRHRVACR